MSEEQDGKYIKYLFSGNADSGLTFFCTQNDDEASEAYGSVTLQLSNIDPETVLVQRLENVPLHEAILALADQIFEDLREDELAESWFELVSIDKDRFDEVLEDEIIDLAPLSTLQRQVGTHNDTLIGHRKLINGASDKISLLEKRHEYLVARVEALERLRS